MADYTNKDGRTWSAIRSTVGIGNDTMGVLKVKPPKVDTTGEKGYELGDPNAVCFIKGRVEIERLTFTVRAKQWDDFATANPDIAAGNTETSIAITLRRAPGDGDDTLTYNYPRMQIMSAAPSELDTGTVSEAVVDVEADVLRARSGERDWT